MDNYELQSSQMLSELRTGKDFSFQLNPFG